MDGGHVVDRRRDGWTKEDMNQVNTALRDALDQMKWRTTCTGSGTCVSAGQKASKEDKQLFGHYFSKLYFNMSLF